MESIIYYILIVIMGLLIGRFLSVIPYCWPLQIKHSLAKSYCTSFQRKITPRYPLIEIVTACVTLATVFMLDSDATWMELFAALLLTWTLVCLTIIDIEHQLLPDNIVLPMLWLGLILNTQTTNNHDAVLGAALGYACLWLLGTSYYYITGNFGIGYGDYKLFAMLGAWFGWQALPTILLLATLLGSTAGILLILIKQYQRRSAIAFGPYLAVAGWCHLI